MMDTRFGSPLVALAGVALGLALPGVAQATCPEPVPTRDLASVVSSGDAAYTALDEGGFRDARAAAARMLPCVDAVLSPSEVASYHRLQALSAFLDRDHAGTVASFRSLLATAPGYMLPDDYAPPNHPMRVDFQVAQGAVGAPAANLRPPRSGAVQVDGKAAEEAPVDRPWVFQYVDGEGQVQTTALVPAGGAVPAYPGGGLASAAQPASGVRVNRPLLAAAGAAAVASTTFYVMARSAEGQFWAPGTPQAELQGLRARTNTLGWLSAGAGAVALGAGASAFLVGSF